MGPHNHWDTSLGFVLLTKKAVKSLVVSKLKYRYLSEADKSGTASDKAANKIIQDNSAQYAYGKCMKSLWVRGTMAVVHSILLNGCEIWTNALTIEI